MPELPEVEVTRRSVQPRIQGARVLAVSVGKPLRWPLGCEPADLVGRVVRCVDRRGKYLWFAFEDGGGLLVHLGMSGSLAFGRLGPAGKHDHFELKTSQGDLRLTDPRRFGAVLWSLAIDQGRAAELLGGLGVEPTDSSWTGATLYAALKGRRKAIKLALLAGDIVVGAGNIYACEALFRAGIHPLRSCDRIGLARCERLVQAVREVLAEALALGGSTLRDFRDTHGLMGAYQAHAAVYGREGLPCRQCSRPIQRVVQAQRSTYYCAHCQR
jgi:formamidopyrimidine-DNA glycosylase